IFLPLRTQEILISYQRILFVVSSLLSSIVLFCLLKKTPVELAKIRNYMILIQISIILTSTYMDALFEPIPLFPLMGTYCVGILCQLGIPMQTLIGILLILYVFIGSSIVFCCFFRHQTLIPTNNTAKF
ncbi:hypothetical protein PFISCL1PPCAC_17204, partial [Pristionchus fissidentatus]